MKCKKCNPKNLKIVISGPHNKLVCDDCMAFQKFLSMGDVKIFNQLNKLDGFKVDALILAKAIIKCPIRIMMGDFVTYLYCIHCGLRLTGSFWKAADFKHDANCPVLVAQDVLTRN